MIAAIRNAVRLKNKPTNAEAIAPQPICKAPVKAHALPAPFEKGAIASAAELGKVKPWQFKIKTLEK